jgi:hypothetical protein
MLNQSAVIVNAIKVENSRVACARIARHLSHLLGLLVLDRKETVAAYAGKTFHTVIVVNSPWQFCGFRDELTSLLQQAKRIIWCQNDYSLAPTELAPLAALLRSGRKLSYWTTIPKLAETSARKYADEGTSAYVNWNLLHYHPLSPMRLAELRGRSHRHALLYYGALRPGREERFRYFFERLSYPLVISSSARYRPRFAALAPRAEIAEMLDDPIAALAQHAATLYVEDDRALRLYCSPAGRFYEALSASTPQFIDERSVENLERDRVPIFEECVVSTPTGLSRKLHDRKLLRRIESRQLREWRKNYAAQLKLQLEGAIRL